MKNEQIITAGRTPIRAAAAPRAAIPPFIESLLFTLLLLLLFLGGTVGCVITGFALPVNSSVLWVGIPLLSTVTVLCGILKRRIAALIPPLLLLAVWTWIRFDLLWEGLRYAAAVIMRYLCAGFPGLFMPPSLQEQAHYLLEAEVSPLLLDVVRAPLTEGILWLAFLAGFVWTLLYRHLRSIVLCAVLPIPAFVLCFLIIEMTVPALWALLFVLLYWILLFFTRFAIRLHTRAASAQAAFLLIPCVLFLLAVYTWYPKETPVGDLVQGGYDRVINAMSSLETKLSDTVADWFSGNLFIVSAEDDTIAFDNLKPRRYFGRTVMKAKSDTTGVVYLREKTYGDYTGGRWEQASPERDPFFMIYTDLTTLSADILAKSGVTESHLSLEGARAPLLFTPYYFSDSTIDHQFQGDRYITNPARTENYDISFYRFSGNFGDLPGTESAKMLEIMIPQYLKIDPTLATQLLILLKENGIAAVDRAPHYVDSAAEVKRLADHDDIWKTVAEITYFVRGSAKYSLQPDIPPADRDFVQWFLEEAEYGYCTHFATAEVMLLRACGIPARLAAGYLCSIRTPDKWTSIRDSDAHAWVEVFDPRLGWIPVEATPPTAISDDIDADRIIVGMTPIPGTSSEDPVETTTDTEAVTETEEITTETTDVTDPTKPNTPNTEPAITDEASGDIGQGGGTAAPSILPQLLRTAGTVLAILLGAALLILFLLFRRRRRKQQIEALFHPEEHDRNRCALRIYRRCTALARACGEDIPAHLTTLAEKARFSQHILSQDELDVLRAWHDEKCLQLQSDDTAFARIRHRWIDLYY